MMMNKFAFCMLSLSFVAFSSLSTAAGTDKEKITLIENQASRIGVLESISKLDNYLFVDAKNESWITSSSGRFVIHSVDSRLKVTDTVRRKEIKFSEISLSKKFIPLDSLGVSLNSKIHYPMYSGDTPKATLIIQEKFLSKREITAFISNNKQKLQVVILDKEFKYCGVGGSSRHIDAIISKSSPAACNQARYSQAQSNLNRLISFTEMELPILISHENWIGKNDPQ